VVSALGRAGVAAVGVRWGPKVTLVCAVGAWVIVVLLLVSPVMAATCDETVVRGSWSSEDSSKSVPSS
jgi:hypothetical protein